MSRLLEAKVYGPTSYSGDYSGFKDRHSNTCINNKEVP